MQHTVMNTVSELLIVRVVETNWDEKDLTVRSMSGLQVLANLYEAWDEDTHTVVDKGT